MAHLEDYQNAFLMHLSSKISQKEPRNLYEPIEYILQLGGKRLRPILSLMSADIFGGQSEKALDAALAIEVFHNFSLVHDDIMDGAPLRRGKPTVHEKWDINTGILSGDAMLIMAYQLLESYEADTFAQLSKLFSKTAIEVCEGQQYDVDFESRTDVTIAEYLQMIKYKTAVLVAAALKMGAIIAGTPKKNQEAIYNFGLNLGIAFQIQDDYLDAFGNPETFGKQIGGDIIENKKTLLYLKACELLEEADRQQLIHLFDIHPNDASEKITRVKELFQTSGAADSARTEISRYTTIAFEVLDTLSIADSQKNILRDFGTSLMNRSV